MAVAPLHLEKVFQEDIKTFENIIDKELLTKTVSKGESLRTNVPYGLKTEHFNILKKKYLDVGWSNVHWDTDQRGEDNLVFTY